MIKHKGGCHCGEITFSTEYDPMLKGLCNCTRCRKIFGTVNAGVMFGEPEVEVSGELKKYTCIGGSGMPVHIYFCSECSCKIYGKPESFEGFIMMPIGVFDDLHKFSPTGEIFTNYKLEWLNCSTLKESFEEAAVQERIEMLMENLDQRE